MTERPNKRAQILDAARRCFNERGITATGVDAIAAAADVSKRTLYNHFPSKEDLVVAYIQVRDERWRALLDERLDGLDDPIERMLTYFDAYFAVPDDEEFRGCALINAAAEAPLSDSRVLDALRANKDRVHGEIAELASEAGLVDPESVATAVNLLLEGSVALSGVHRDRDGSQAAKAVARRVVAAYTPGSAG